MLLSDAYQLLRDSGVNIDYTRPVMSCLEFLAEASRLRGHEAVRVGDEETAGYWFEESVNWLNIEFFLDMCDGDMCDGDMS